MIGRRSYAVLLHLGLRLRFETVETLLRRDLPTLFFLHFAAAAAVLLLLLLLDDDNNRTVQHDDPKKYCAQLPLCFATETAAMFLWNSMLVACLH